MVQHHNVSPVFCFLPAVHGSCLYCLGGQDLQRREGFALKNSIHSPNIFSLRMLNLSFVTVFDRYIRMVEGIAYNE